MIEYLPRPSWKAERTIRKQFSEPVIRDSKVVVRRDIESKEFVASAS